MNLKTLFWLAALTYTLVIGGSLLLYRLYIVFPVIEAATIDARMQSIKGISARYMNERDSLIVLNRDWAKRDAAYEFVKKQNPAFIKKNFQKDTFKEFNIDAFAILDMDGKTLYAASKQNTRFTRINQAQQISDDLDISQIISADGHFGVIKVKDQYGLYVSHHIQDDQHLNAANGVLIFIRIFKPEFFERIKKNTNVTVSINKPTPPSTSVQNLYNFKITDIKDDYYFNLVNTRDDVIAQTAISFPINSSPKAIDTLTLVSILALLTLPIFLSGLTNFLILKPGLQISKNISLMKSTGNVFHLTQKSYIKEVNEFLKTFNTLVDKINVHQQELVRDSNTDGLTGIYNRKYFDLEYDKSWRISTLSGGPFSIIMMDIDYFKKYNDHYGHLQGDIALKEVAAALNQVTRRAEDTTARYGGEEFVIISHAKSKKKLKEILNFILKSVSQLDIKHAKSQTADTLTISCGACFIENNGADMKYLKLQALKLADEALYSAKENGRNQFCISTFNDLGSPPSKPT